MKTKTDPRRTDETHRRAGSSYSRCAPMQKHLAQARGVSDQRVSQVVNGDPSGIPERFYTLIEQLARHPKTNPWPLIVGAVGIVEGVYAEWPTEDLWTELLDVMDSETTEEAGENVATHRVIRAFQSGDAEEMVEALETFVEKSESEMAEQWKATALARVIQRRLG